MRKKPTYQPPAVPAHIAAFRSAQARGFRLWDATEKALVVKLYPDFAAMQAALPHRTRSALHQVARRWAISKRLHVWTIVEIARLKRLWSSGASQAEINAAFSGLTWNQIRSMAAKHGLGRRPKAPMKFDVTVLDKIRQRAADDGYTLIELDRLAGTGTYFQSSTRFLRYKHIEKGIIALGGTMDIDWNREA